MAELYQQLSASLRQEQGIALATVVRGPTYIGNKILVSTNASTQGSLGNTELDSLVIPDAEQAIWQSEARIYTYTLPTSQQHFDIFIEGFAPSPELIIVGAGHIAIPLTSIAKTLHYHVVVIDARASFATRERFPHADELIVAWPDEVLASRPLFPSTAIAILTHDPKFDEPTLKVVLERRVAYVGAIGSRKTSQERAERLQQQGLDAAQIARIHGPIGLNIGAKSPEEIALAIMAEIVAVRHQQH